MSSPQPPERVIHLLIDSVRDYAIFLLDREGHVQTWNRGAQAIKGYTRDEIVGHALGTFYTPEDRAAGLPDHLLSIARREGRVEHEGWRVRKDGTRFWADAVITALFDEHDELVGYAKVTRDLTERRHAEELRLQQEQRFRFIVESVRDYAIFMLDRDGRVATWNLGAERIKGYSADEIIGQHFSVFYDPAEVASGKVAGELEIALREGKFEEENWRVRKDGGRFWASVVITPLRDSNGMHVGYAKVTRDLTDRKRAEDERVRLAQTQEAVRLRDDFLSIASHELRTPLMALRLQLDSARALATDLDAKLTTRLDRSRRSIDRLAGLVDTLLDVARIASGRLSVHPERGDLGAIVEDSIERLEEAAASAGCVVVSRLDRGIIGNWDPLRVGQVVSNLLSNAFKYASGTQIDVELRAASEQVVLSVADRGPGIEVDHLARIFGRFERAASLRHFGGLGLGLYIANEIVVAHGGTIEAKPRDGGGALFEIRLPAQGAA